MSRFSPTPATGTVQGPAVDAPLALVELRGVTKRFGQTEALRGVDLEVRQGELHALLGSNGAGKSTLIKILDGLHRADGGSIAVRSTVPGREHGVIGVIHQDLGLIDSLTIAENFHLTRTSGNRRLGLVDGGAERRAAEAGLRAVGLELDVSRKVGDVNLGVRSLIAVAILVSKSVDVFVLDEVTAALTRKESDWVLGHMRSLAEAGSGVIVVSHRLHEITENCDRVTVVKDGRTAFTGPTPDIAALHGLLTDAPRGAGQRPAPVAPSQEAVAPALRLRAASGNGVGPVTVDVHPGEVLGIIGPLASKLYEIGHLIAGTVRTTAGERHVRPVDGRPGRIGFLAEDRRTLGLLPGLSVEQNMTVSSLSRFSRRGWVRKRAEDKAVAASSASFNVHPADPSAKVEALSGGNQQKVLLLRAGLMRPDVYVLCEPSRGVDVSTRQAIYRFVADLRDAGAAVVIVSIDADDVLAMSDRIAIADDGRLLDPLPASSMTAAALLEKVS